MKKNFLLGVLLAAVMTASPCFADDPYRFLEGDSLKRVEVNHNEEFKVDVYKFRQERATDPVAFTLFRSPETGHPELTMRVTCFNTSIVHYEQAVLIADGKTVELPLSGTDELVTEGLGLHCVSHILSGSQRLFEIAGFITLAHSPVTVRFYRKDGSSFDTAIAFTDSVGIADIAMAYYRMAHQ